MAPLSNATALLQIAEPLLDIEGFAPRQQVEKAHCIATTTAQKHDRQLIVIALEGHWSGLRPIQRLHPNAGLLTRSSRYVEYKHGAPPLAKG